VGVTGVVLSKLDGTARGGMAVVVEEELGIPVKLIGVGESADDLLHFSPEAFVDSLLEGS
jgi:fused signal recognition particle receptor